MSAPAATLPTAAASERNKGPILEVLRASGLMSSNAEARRMVRQGAVTLDGNKVEDEATELMLETGREYILKVGPRRFKKLLAG